MIHTTISTCYLRYYNFFLWFLALTQGFLVWGCAQPARKVQKQETLQQEVRQREASSPVQELKVQGLPRAETQRLDISTPPQRLDGFLGIPWGTSMKQAVAQMLTRPGVTLYESKENAAAFLGGTFGGKPVSFSILVFFEDRLAQANVFFKPKEHEIIQEYRKLVADLTEKYSKPEKSYEGFDKPYREGDGYETTAIRVGKALFTALWTFPTPNGKPNAVVVQIMDSLQIRATYECGDIMNFLVNKNKQKAREDY